MKTFWLIISLVTYSIWASQEDLTIDDFLVPISLITMSYFWVFNRYKIKRRKR